MKVGSVLDANRVMSRRISAVGFHDGFSSSSFPCFDAVLYSLWTLISRHLILKALSLLEKLHGTG